MATIKTKFSEGETIEHFTGIRGMVTAIFHRSGKNSYEMSYLDDSKPTCTNVQECEISACDNNHGNLGFKRDTKERPTRNGKKGG